MSNVRNVLDNIENITPSLSRNVFRVGHYSHFITHLDSTQLMSDAALYMRDIGQGGNKGKGEGWE